MKGARKKKAKHSKMPDRAFLKRILFYAGPRLFFFVLAGVLWCLMAERMELAAREMPYFEIHPKDFRLVNNAPWMNAAIEAEIKSPPQMPTRMNYFDPFLLENISRSYEQFSWVEGVAHVGKRFPRTIDLKLNLRKPVAAVSFKGKCFLVDRRSVRLSAKDYVLKEFSHELPSIIGATSKPPSIPGVTWTDHGVKGAVLVLNLLETWPRRQEIRISRVDVQNINGQVNPKDSEIVLWTDRNVKIEWGRSPDTGKYGEVPPRRKLDHLGKLLDQQPGLEGVKTARIRFDKVIYVPAL